jgi:glycosyltransferase involved in cell wall biosynthesis
MPVFNGGEHLVPALECILSQDLDDLEIIVSDNGSTDGTPEIIETYVKRDTRIRAFQHPKNIGAALNWRFVALQARGRYFKWASANDLFEPSLIGRCVGFLDTHPDYALCHSRTGFIDDRNQHGPIFDGDFAVVDEDPTARFQKVVAELRLCTPLQCGVVRTDVIRRYGYLGNYQGSDMVLVALIALAGKIALLPDVLYWRRWSEATATPLRTPLEQERMIRPDAKAPAIFVDARRHIGYFSGVFRAPLSARDRSRALYAATQHLYWRRRYILDELKEAIRVTVPFSGLEAGTRK